MTDGVPPPESDGLGDLADALAGGRPAGGDGVPDEDARNVARAARALGTAWAVTEEEIADAVARAAETREPPPPTLLGEHEILGEIGRGGMGVVYRARHRGLERVVALKVLRPGDALFGSALARFEREARALARLRHPHIVSVHEVGEAAGRLCFTMDLVEGHGARRRGSGRGRAGARAGGRAARAGRRRGRLRARARARPPRPEAREHPARRGRQAPSSPTSGSRSRSAQTTA